MTDKHADVYSKIVCLGCINCKYKNIAKIIGLFDKISFFVRIVKCLYKQELLRSKNP